MRGSGRRGQQPTWAVVRLTLLASLLACLPFRSLLAETSCTDGVDDDGDTLVDCDDDDCQADPACPDVVRPTEVDGLRVAKAGVDVALAWNATSLDHAGQPERVRSYRVYAGASGRFVPDVQTFTNRLGTPTGTSFTHAGALLDGANHYYLASAVDRLGMEGNTRPANVTLPVLSSGWTPTTVTLSWTDALPRARLWRYRVYYGTRPRQYDTALDVGVATSGVIPGLLADTIYYFAVTAIDRSGNETDFSNEVHEALGGTVTVHAMDQGHSVWGGTNPYNGWEPQSPVLFPPVGEWTRVTMALTLDSRLTSPCDCAGVGNCYGDEWDRTVLVFLVLDESCLGGRCAGRWDSTQLELLHAITPFGTDGRTGPRILAFDVTPYASLLAGARWIGVQIGTYGGQGWWSNVDFTFTEDPASASPKPPATGIIPLWFRDGVGAGNQASITPTRITIPPQARIVKGRLWVTGHGGGDATGHPECIGPADEFCRKTNRIVVDGATAWQSEVWRDCSTGCRTYNACGYPSCTYSRAGWCPGTIACHTNAPCDQDLDLTASLPPGDHDISYEVINPNPGGSWVYSLALYWYP